MPSAKCPAEHFLLRTAIYGIRWRNFFAAMLGIHWRKGPAYTRFDGVFLLIFSCLYYNRKKVFLTTERNNLIKKCLTKVEFVNSIHRELFTK